MDLTPLVLHSQNEFANRKPTNGPPVLRPVVSHTGFLFSCLSKPVFLMVLRLLSLYTMVGWCGFVPSTRRTGCGIKMKSTDLNNDVRRMIFDPPQSTMRHCAQTPRLSENESAN